MDKDRYQKFIQKQRKLHEGQPCETCGKQHNHNYGTGRFCCKRCAQLYKRSRVASPKLKAHLDKLRKEGKISVKAPYGTWKCQKCGCIFETAYQLQQHQLFSYGRVLTKNETSNKTFKCQYCGKEFKKPQSLGAHMLSCEKHPKHKQHIKMHKKIGDKLSNLYRLHPELTSQYGKHITPLVKQKLSKARAKQLQTEYLDKDYAHIKWYKVRNIKGEEYSVRGHWEENVALQLNKLGIYWTKSKPLKYFDVYWHNYIPDFYVPEFDVYIEVKGRYPESDKKKMTLVVKQNPDKRIYFIKDDSYHDFISGKIPFDDKLLINERYLNFC